MGWGWGNSITRNKPPKITKHYILVEYTCIVAHLFTYMLTHMLTPAHTSSLYSSRIIHHSANLILIKPTLTHTTYKPHSVLVHPLTYHLDANSPHHTTSTHMKQYPTHNNTHITLSPHSNTIRRRGWGSLLKHIPLLVCWHVSNSAVLGIYSDIFAI